jgi:elongator complex protein 3
VRITRLIRDIPSQAIVAGATTPNLRETVQKEMKERGRSCSCIRCREIREKSEAGKEVQLIRRDYEASEGKEIFLSFEDEKRENLYALLRLRIPAAKNNHFIPSLEKAAIIRELHTYGAEVPIEDSKSNASQHKGLGKKLMKEAEELAGDEFGFAKLAVISGVGVRNYYRKLGYKLKGEYMLKKL